MKNTSKIEEKTRNSTLDSRIIKALEKLEDFKEEKEDFIVKKTKNFNEENMKFLQIQTEVFSL